MWKKYIVFPAIFLAAPVLFAQDSKPAQTAVSSEFKIPLDAVKEVNPVKPTPESLARGKKIYGYDCAMCHGVDGGGKGDLASDMKTSMGDYRDPKTLKDKTDGELAYIIKNGKGEMSGEGERAKGDRLWDLVNYIRSFSKNDAAKSKEKSTE